MSSATRDDPLEHPSSHGLAEDEPLLGIRGDASQPEGHGIFNNLFLGISSLPTTSLASWTMEQPAHHGIEQAPPS
jgi:hypothetical protein